MRRDNHPGNSAALLSRHFVGCVGVTVRRFHQAACGAYEFLERLEPNQPRDRVGVFVYVSDFHALVELSSQAIKSFVGVLRENIASRI